MGTVQVIEFDLLRQIISQQKGIYYLLENYPNRRPPEDDHILTDCRPTAVHLEDDASMRRILSFLVVIAMCLSLTMSVSASEACACGGDDYELVNGVWVPKGSYTPPPSTNTGGGGGAGGAVGAGIGGVVETISTWTGAAAGISWIVETAASVSGGVSDYLSSGSWMAPFETMQQSNMGW